MSEKVELKSEDNRSKVTLLNGQLSSYLFDQKEIMHQKGDPGWNNTEIEMFPIIGATKGNNFSISTPKSEAKLDQHGILRVMKYNLLSKTSSEAKFDKNYTANTILSNPKFPDRSTLSSLSWPYNFDFKKSFKITNKGLVITFEISSEKDMPYMLGFHPAFKIYNSSSVFKTSNKQFSLSQILEAGSNAFPIKNCNQVILTNNGDVEIDIKTSGFRHIMFWSEVPNMVCIEPITFYPSSVSAKELYQGFDKSSGYEKFEIMISPSKL